MTVQKQTVPVPIIDGLSDNDDNFASNPPGWIEIAEARWARDKQIGKRLGISAISIPGDGSAVVTSTDPNQIVDLDDVPHVVAGSGTMRLDPTTSKWVTMGGAAPRASRVVSDPVVRTNYGAIKSDAAIVGNTVMTVWEEHDPLGTVAGAFYAFHDVSEDTPRLISGPTFCSTVTSGMRVVGLAGRYFVLAGLDGSDNIYVNAYDTNAGTWTLGAWTLLEQTNDRHYALAPSYDATSAAYLVYLSKSAGARRAKKLSTAGAVTATATMNNSDVQHCLHNGPLAKLVVIGRLGDIAYIADNLGGATTTATPFTNPASGTYTGKFYRATIGLADTSGNMWLARSTAGPYSFTGTSPYATQALYLDTTFAASKQNLWGGVVLAGHFSPYISESGTAYCALASQGAYYTSLYDVSGYSNLGAFKAAPAAYVVRFFTSSASVVEAAVQAKYGVDGIDLTGNTAAGTPTVSSSTSHLPHLAYDETAATYNRRLVSAFPVLVQNQFGGTAGTQRKRGVDLVQVRPHISTPTRNVYAQTLRVLGGGTGASMIDGVIHAELTPPPIEALLFYGYDSNSTGNSLFAPAAIPPNIQGHLDFTGVPAPYNGANPNRQWGFQVLWRYTDAKGNIHRGSPSSIYYCLRSELVDGSGFAGRLSFPAWHPTALIGDKYVSPEVEVYACPPDGNGAYKLLGVVAPKAHPSDEGLVFVSVLSGGSFLVSNAVALSTWDNVVQAPPQLYTTANAGSELDSWPAPPLLSICSTQSRLWGLNGQDRLDVWYTKPLALGIAPEWSSTLRVRIPQDGGPAVGIAAIDDKVVVFKKTKVFVIEGDAGDSAGNNASLRRPRLVSSDVGCIAVESIVEGPFGVIFLSERGFFTLDRGLSYQFVGAPVMDRLSAASSDGLTRTIISSCIVPSESEVRFIADTNRGSGDLIGLTWNYRHNRWTSRDANAPRFSATVGGVEWMVYRNTTGEVAVYKETPFVWTNQTVSGSITTATTALMSMRSSWIKLGGIAGFGRVWRVVLTLRWYSGGIQVQTAQDYKPETETVKTWTHTQLAALADATSGILQLDIRPTVQKCEAIQLVISERAGSQQEGGSATGGRGWELLGVDLEVGVKKGAFKRIGQAARK